MEKDMTTKEKVNMAFKLLRKAGYFAKQNFWCCQSCAWSNIPEGIDKVVFYHNQDNDSWENKELKKDLYLAWSGSGQEIVSILSSVGLNLDWNGSEDKRIRILKTI